MKKPIIRIFSLLLAGSFLLGLAGCAKPEKSAGYRIWSTHNTTKVIQQASRNHTYPQREARLCAQLMQDEYEGAQLIITAESDLTYTLTAGPLKNEAGEVFPAKNIQIYHQKYQTVKTHYNGDAAFQAGDAIPDMLLPMDIAAAYGENKIAANTNQGITVEFHSKDVPAGIYTGSFTLDLNGKTTDIPVRVEVWDIRYEGRREFQSCFVLYRDEIFTGEYRNTDDVVDAYVNTLLEHKVNTYVAQSFYTPELLAEEARRLYQNHNWNSLCIPYGFYTGYQVYEYSAITEDAQLAVDYIKALVRISTPEENYLPYMYFYLGGLDEADVVDGRWEPSEEILRDGGAYQQTLELAVQQLKAEGWFAQQSPEFAAQTEAAILQIPAVFTNVNFIEEWVGELNAAFCPYLSVFHDTAVLNHYQDAAAGRSNGHIWAYTCYGPTDPYPTLHIDDGTLDKRVCGWMEKAYGITGYLYYKVNNYAYLHHAPEDRYLDVYATPARYGEVNGDGFLLYPGRYYGSQTPFSTLRLTAYRDGMDDYDMLCVYEQLLTEYAKKQGLPDFDFSLYVEDLYRTLFNGMVASQDADALYAAREQLAKRILALRNEDTLLYDPMALEVRQVTDFSGDSQAVVIRSEYKDKNEEIGSKTKLFRPCFEAAVTDFTDAKTLSFSYENTGTQNVDMDIILVTADGQTISAGTSFCAPGSTRQVRIQLAGDLPEITAIRLSFDNVTVDAAGQTVLLPDRVFTVSNFYI